MIKPIEAALLSIEDGTAFSKIYEDPYWSREGGLDETRQVFLAGNHLPERWQTRSVFTLLETGFGSGLNFLCAWKLFRETAPAGAHLHYLSVDKHPLRRTDLAHLYTHWPELAPLAHEFLEGYPPLVSGFHRLHLERGRVHLTLLFGEAADLLAQVTARVDAFFLDGFAPSKNPDMWSERIFAELGRLAAPGATFATYTAAGKVSRGMTAAGFNVTKQPGFGRKREMLSGYFAGAPVHTPIQERRALILGAGIAGCTLAERLAARGWSIELIERRDAPARETSGNPAGVLQPVPSLDGNRLSRLTLAGFLYALHRLRQLSTPAHPIGQSCGVLRLARNEKQIERQRRIATSGLYPPELLRWVEIEEASALAGARVPAPGWWFPQGTWLHPPALCAALLHAAGDTVRLHTQREVADLVRTSSGWQAVDASGVTIAEAPIALLANGYLARRLMPHLPLRPVRGQVSCLAALSGSTIRCVVAREGYVTPATHFGVQVIGATYAEGDINPLTTEEDHLANLERLHKLLPDFAQTVDPARLAGRAGIRSVGPDRLPLVGEITGHDGLYGLLGLGSRGLVYGPLCAELLACTLSGEPLPVERDLAVGLTPAVRMKAQR